MTIEDLQDEEQDAPMKPNAVLVVGDVLNDTMQWTVIECKFHALFVKTEPYQLL